MTEAADLDRLIHEPARLVLVSHLFVVEEADFVYLSNRTARSLITVSPADAPAGA